MTSERKKRPASWEETKETKKRGTGKEEKKEEEDELVSQEQKNVWPPTCQKCRKYLCSVRPNVPSSRVIHFVPLLLRTVLCNLRISCLFGWRSYDWQDCRELPSLDSKSTRVCDETCDLFPRKGSVPLGRRGFYCFVRYYALHTQAIFGRGSESTPPRCAWRRSLEVYLWGNFCHLC